MDVSYSYQTEMSPVTVVFMVAFAVLLIVAEWRLFEKAGEPGWAAIVPLYNLYTLFKIAWGNGWKMLFLLIPFANIVFSIMVYVKLSHSFGKRGGFCVGVVLLPYVFLPIMAFTEDIKYIAPDDGSTNTTTAA